MRSFSFNVGTPLYQSPEQEMNKPYNEKVDMFALGIILLEICSEFSTGHERDMMLRALKLERQVDPGISSRFKEESEMIMKLTAHSASDRPDAKQILEEILHLETSMIMWMINLILIQTYSHSASVETDEIWVSPDSRCARFLCSLFTGSSFGRVRISKIGTMKGNPYKLIKNWAKSGIFKIVNSAPI